MFFLIHLFAGFFPLPVYLRSALSRAAPAIAVNVIIPPTTGKIFILI